VRGFTLIELLISISIIAVAFGVVISSGSAIQKNSRDAKRKTDLAYVQSALQQYYADQNSFPDSISFGGSLTANGKTYSSKLPTDPSGQSYCYESRLSAASTSICSSTDNSGKCQYYLLATCLETVGISGSCSCSNNNYSLHPL
jgi:prepilin-type N-terminal cleavage/methylation domain-containing protein